MIFPQDVEKYASQAKKIQGGEKVRLYIVGFLGINFFVGMVTIPFFSSLGVPAIVPILAQLLVTIIAFVYVYKIFIFKEEEKLQEFEDGMVDSFSNYYYLRNIDTGDLIKAKKADVQLFELDNGASIFYLKFLFGETDPMRAKNTREIFRKIYKILGSYRMEFSQTISSEEFEDSQEAKKLIAEMSSIEDPRLSKTMLEILDGLLKISENMSNVDCVTIRVKTRVGSQRYDIEALVNELMDAIYANRNSFRSVKIMVKQEVLDFFKSFYGLEAIDLAFMKIRDSKIGDGAFRKFVEVYALVNKNGSVKIKGRLENEGIKVAKKLKL